MTYEDYIKPIEFDLARKMNDNSLTFMELILFLLISINDKLDRLNR